MSKFRPTHRSSAPVKNQLVLYGRHAVLAALANPLRQLNKLFCLPETAEEIRKAAADRGLSPQIVERKEIDRLLPPDAVHQGFALFCQPLPGISLEELCEKARDKENAYVLILDQVTDPQNIGAIIRSCAAFGALALIMQDKNAPAESGAMAKAAAGTLELLPLCRVTNISRAVDRLKTDGFWTIGMDGYAQTTVDKLNKSGKTAIIMGSEGKGLRRLVEENCDSTVRLPISEQVESLNVSTAAAIVLYEMSKD